MKVNEVRKIKSIESEFLKLSKNGNVQLSMIAHNHEPSFFGADSGSLFVEMQLFDSDLGSVKVSIEAMSPLQVENLRVVLEMLQGSV